MNPENVGEQIRLRHSSLWRQPLQYEKPTPEVSSCHRQLNERTPLIYSVGTSGQSWRIRNNSISTHTGGFRNKSSISRKCNSDVLEDLLSEKDKQPNLQRSFVKSLR
jgi:hypothetical protein